MARLDFRGGAAKCTASGSISSGATSVALTGDTSGWPTGASGRNFVAIIDRGVAGKVEKVLCSALTAGTLTIATRGYDGTVAVAHDANCTVEHGISAAVLDDYGAHMYDDTRDDHSQYMLTDGSRAFSDLGTVADAPVDIGTALAEGTSDLVARADHVHKIPAGFITSAMIADGTIVSGDIADGTIAAGDIADGAITIAKFGSGLQPVRVIANAAARPGSPTVGMTVYQLDTAEFLQYHGATTGWGPPWNSKWGHMGTRKNVTAPQGSISSETDVTGSSFTFTAVANRIYKHTVRAIVAHTVSNAAMVIKITDAANTEKDRGALHSAATGSNDTLFWSWLELGLSAGSVTRKLRAVPGSGSMSIQNDDAPLQYSIEDDGPNGLPS